MELFRYRHLALGCAGFIYGLYLSYFHLGTQGRILIICLAVLSLLVTTIIYLITKKRSVLDKLIKYAPLCFFIALSMTVSLICFGRGENLISYAGEKYEIEAEVQDTSWEGEYGGIYILKISKIDGESVKGEAVLESYGTLLDKGNKITVFGTINELGDNKYGFSEKSAYLEDGILVSVECDEIELTSGEIKEKSIFKRVNKYLDSRFENNLNSDTYGLFSALLLGNKENLSLSVSRDFARLGISHVLSLSGMHLTLLATLLSLLLSVFKTPKPIKLVLLIFAVAFFVALTGFSASCVRAGLMTILYFSFRLLGRGTDSVTSLFFSVTLILIFFPYCIFSVSLILSFLSMLGCIVSSKLIRHAKLNKIIKRRIFRYVAYTFITSFVVIGFTSIVLLIFFGEISVFSPISNLILAPIFTGFIYFAPFLLILCGVPYISVPFVFIAESGVEIISDFMSALSHIKGVSLPIYGFWQTAGLVGVLTVFVVAMVVRRKYLFKMLALLSVFIVCFMVGTTANYIEKQTSTYVSAMNYIGDDYLIIEDEGKLSVVDMSRSRKKNLASNITSVYHYSEIESYVLLNYSSASAEYIESIVSWNIVRELYLPNPKDDEEAAVCAEISEIAKKQGTSVAVSNESVMLGDTELLINRVELDRSTYDCVSVSFKINGVSVAYFGASSYEAFDYFTAKHAPNADIIIFGEGGPKYKLEYTYELNSVDYCVYMGDSYDFASEKVKSATRDKEFLLKNDYARIKIQGT